MGRFSPAFLAQVAADEVAEQFGFYFRNPKRHLRHYLDHRALALAADANGGVPYVMWGRLGNWKASSYLRADGNVFWLRTDELDAFVAQVLPHLRRRIVLVTSEADYAPLLHAPAAVEKILASDLVGHWYCAQTDIPREVAKHTALPLGLPYPYRNDIHFGARWLDIAAHWTRRYEPEQFDRKLAELVRARKPLTARKPVAFADFSLNNTSQFAPWGETRGQIAQKLAGNGAVTFLPGRVDQFSLYRLYGEHAFVLSPFGRGRDCYRTWEALLMGAIPIVKTSPLDAAFDGFPVVLIEDWSEVTAENLSRWQLRYAGAWDDGAVDRGLTLSYWVDQIRAKAATLA
jgi:hypothetical protein